jgi:hypothetical protein
MEWEEKVEKKVKSVEEEAESFLPRRYAAEIKVFLDKFLPYSLILLGSLLTVNYFGNIKPSTARLITMLNWVLVSYFSLRLAMAFRLAESDRDFLRQHWFDALLILPAFTLIQEVRGLILLEEVGEEEATAGIMMGRNTSLAAQITRIIRIVKKSISF